MKAKPHNTEFFNSITSTPMRRYALWLMGSPGYGYSIFDGMDKALRRQDDEALEEYESAYPAESDWFTKHLQNDPAALEIQKQLFNINN